MAIVDCKGCTVSPMNMLLTPYVPMSRLMTSPQSGECQTISVSTMMPEV